MYHFQTANSWLFILYMGDFITFTTSFYYMVFLRIVLACAGNHFLQDFLSQTAINYYRIIHLDGMNLSTVTKVNVAGAQN